MTPSLFLILYPPGGGGNFVSSRLNSFFQYSSDTGDLAPRNEYHKADNPFISLAHPEELLGQELEGRRILVIKPGLYCVHCYTLNRLKHQQEPNKNLNYIHFCRKQNRHYNFWIKQKSKQNDILAVEYADLFVDDILNTLRQIVTWMGLPDNTHNRRLDIMSYKFREYHRQNIKLIEDARTTNIIDD